MSVSPVTSQSGLVSLTKTKQKLHHYHQKSIFSSSTSHSSHGEKMADDHFLLTKSKMIVKVLLANVAPVRQTYLTKNFALLGKKTSIITVITLFYHLFNCCCCLSLNMYVLYPNISFVFKCPLTIVAFFFKKCTFCFCRLVL